MTNQIPEDWGKDVLSQFIEMAQRNTIASFVNLRPQYKRLRDIDILYRDLLDNLTNTPDWFCGFFLLRAHANYLGAVRLALSGQAAETHMLLRGCLENALYSLYFQRNPESAKTWLSRSDNKESRQRVKDEFKVGAMFRCLLSVDSNIQLIAKQLYERTIDFGAHPNEGAILPQMEITEDDNFSRFDLGYLTSGPAMTLALKTAAQVGVCSLHIFRLIFKERFDILQLTDRLKELEVGL